MKRLSSYFFRGLIFTIPLAATIYVFYLAFTKIDRLLGLPVPGAGFIFTIILITLIGFLASHLVTNRIVNIIDKVFKKMPIVRLLHSSIRDVLTAFMGDKKSFERPVFVTLIPGSDVKIIGFITKENLASLGMDDEVAVYIPQSYNFAGNLIVVPRKQITAINANSSDVMAFIVSGGVVQINNSQKKRKFRRLKPVPWDVVFVRSGGNTCRPLFLSQ